MKTNILLIFLFIIFQFSLIAQQVITSAGDNPKNNTASLQWTLGQIVTGTTTDGSTSLIQGFQQSTIIVSSIYEADDLDYSLKVYPNPTKSFLTIEIDKQDKMTFSANLYNITGK